MNFFETFLVSLGLAMDAFAVSVCKGLSMKKKSIKKTIIISGYFGFFQMLMPIIGFLLGMGFSNLLENIDHWIAFILLSYIGINMIKESKSENEKLNDSTDVKTMFILAIATSIDALAIGVTYAFLNVQNYFEIFATIGVITFIFSFIGVKIGNKFGDKFGNKAELTGGIILILIGIKILLEHL